MKKFITILISLLLCAITHIEAKEYKYEVTKIWDNGLYNSFTSLIKYKGYYYCTFREGKGHVFDEETGKAEGKIRIIRSKNLKKWESVHLIGEADKDYRDPKLSIMPDGRLMVSIGVSIYVNRVSKGGYSATFYSEDGVHYSTPEKCQIQDTKPHKTDWIWRVTWNGDTGYGVDYFTYEDGSRGITLLKTKDGIHFDTMTALEMDGFPNEATIRFLSDGRMAIMVRRDGNPSSTLWGISSSPYMQWKWGEIPFFIGGPDFALIDDTKIIAGGRNVSGQPGWPTTTLYTGDVQNARFHEAFVLPSGGDTSYPGILIDGKYVLVSYYASHERNWPSIYLAKIPLSAFDW